MFDAHFRQEIPAALLILRGVEFRDQGDTDGDPLWADQRQQFSEIFQHQRIIPAGVAAVNIRVGVLAIHIKMVDAFRCAGYIFPGNGKGGFGAKMPLWPTDPAKIL